ncbi:hypothetical protein BDV59DRAFT_167756 [Aspergillus ambiguus]|uniref:Leucine Rich Repeat domain protein n=1 Tax=Aspergillus ambiguus TaxID=176160 RepID=UPI003CCE2113
MGSLGLARGDPTALQKHGQKLYLQGRFGAAIEVFTEALGFKDVDVLTVLDNRAGTYSKLAQYDQALRDARQMIKTDKDDERGYLRCAKTLILDGKHDKALEVYEYALKSLRPDHPRRKVLEQLHKKLHERTVAKCHDPFTIFPLEVATMILSHFSFKQIVAILRVSKQWDRFLSSMRDLWMRIDLSGARGKIHWSSVRAYINRSKVMLTSAVVTNLSVPSTKRVMEFFSRCPRLEDLEIWTPFSCQDFYELYKNSKRLKRLMVSSDIPVPQEYIAKFLAALPLLERIEIYQAKSSPQSKATWPSTLPHLRSITFGTIEPSRPSNHVPALHIPSREDASRPCPITNLEELRLNSNPHVFIPCPPTFNPFNLPRLRRLDLSGMYIGDDFALPPSLQYLRIRGGAGADEFPFSNLHPLQLPNLHTLIFSDVPWVTHATVHVFLECKSPLAVLHVDSCFRILGGPFAKLICEHANKLTDLNVSHISGITDAVVESFSNNLMDLKSLDLGYTEITGCAIKTLADTRGSGGAQVERISARGCEGISLDAVAYGRTNGIEVFA